MIFNSVTTFMHGKQWLYLKVATVVSFNAGGPQQYEVGGGDDVAVIKRLYINEPNISVSFSPGAWFTSV